VEVLFSCDNLVFKGTQEGYAVFFFRKKKKNQKENSPAAPDSIKGSVRARPVLPETADAGSLGL
jgi:hypothetical protein